MAKAVIFDVDGTLVDSVDLHAKAWQDAFAAFGHEVRFVDVRAQIGKGGDELMPVFLSEHELADEGEALSARHGEILKANYLHEVRPFPKVREPFERIRDSGRAIVLASSAHGAELEHYKKLAGVADLVAKDVSSDDAERSKPHPDIFEAAFARLRGIEPNVEAKDIIVVGDTPYDAEAAKKLGLRTIGLLCGGFAEDDLRDAGCIAVFENPADLLAQFGNSPIVKELA